MLLFRPEGAFVQIAQANGLGTNQEEQSKVQRTGSSKCDDRNRTNGPLGRKNSNADRFEDSFHKIIKRICIHQSVRIRILESFCMLHWSDINRDRCY